MKNCRSILPAQDQTKSILCTTSQAMPRGQFTYAPYGTDRRKASPDTALGFNGELRSHDASHYLLGNGKRAFWPSIMRFGTPDLLSPFARGGINSYAYCNNDPVNYSDPSGQNGVPRLTSLAAQAAIKSSSTFSAIAKSLSVEAVSNRSLIWAGRGSSIIDRAEVHLEATRKMTPRQFKLYVSRKKIPPEVASHISSSRTLGAFSGIYSSMGYRYDIFVKAGPWLGFRKTSLKGVFPADSALFMKARAELKSSGPLSFDAYEKYSSQLQTLYQGNALRYFQNPNLDDLRSVNPHHRRETLFSSILDMKRIRN